MTDRKNFESLLDEYHSAVMANNMQRMVLARNGLTAAYDAGREGQPVAWANETELSFANAISDEYVFSVGNCEMAPFAVPLFTNPAPKSDAEPAMCPNCVTPWKCNGPHEPPKADAAADWVCVPRESTWDMRKAAKAAGIFDPRVAEATWNAMIQASPARVGEGEK